MLNSPAKLILVFSGPDLSPPQQAQPKIVSDPGLPNLEIPPWPTPPDLWPVEAWMAADTQILPKLLMNQIVAEMFFSLKYTEKFRCQQVPGTGVSIKFGGRRQEGKV